VWPPIDISPTDFRQSTETKKLPRAVADAAAGIIIAVADIDGPPERVFDALTTDEVVKWWKNPELYRTAEFNADRRVCGGRSQLVHSTTAVRGGFPSTPRETLLGCRASRPGVQVNRTAPIGPRRPLTPSRNAASLAARIIADGNLFQ
jgi:hypothetical protein